MIKIGDIIKGQFFVIAAIIITTSLVMISGLMGIYSISETSVNENINLVDRRLQNIAGEYENIIAISSMKQDANYSMCVYLSNFSEYMRDQEDIKLLWLSVYVNGTSQDYYVNVGNYLHTDIDLVINATDSTPAGTSMTLSDMSNGTYAFSPQISGTINLILKYSLEGEQIEDIISFSASEKNSSAGFFDISLLSGETRVRTKSFCEIFSAG